MRKNLKHYLRHHQPHDVVLMPSTFRWQVVLFKQRNFTANILQEQVPRQPRWCQAVGSSGGPQEEMHTRYAAGNDAKHTSYVKDYLKKNLNLYLTQHPSGISEKERNSLGLLVLKTFGISKLRGGKILVLWMSLFYRLCGWHFSDISGHAIFGWLLRYGILS